MEIDFIVVDESSKALKEISTESSCLSVEPTTAQQKEDDNMATTAASVPGPLRIFQEASPLSSNAPVQLYGSAGLSFTGSQSKKMRINERRGYVRQPSPPPRTNATLGEAGKIGYSAQVAPFARGFGGSTDSLPHMDGMIICPHLHPMAPNSASLAGSQSPATFYTPVNDCAERQRERDVPAVHTLDTRLTETAGDCWSPLIEEATEHARFTAATSTGVGTVAHSLPAPLQDNRDSAGGDNGWSREDPQSQTSTGEGYPVQEEVSKSRNARWRGASAPRRALHRPLTRLPQRSPHHQSVHHHVAKKTVSDDEDDVNASGAAETRTNELFLVTPGQDAPLLLGRTKPVPPPKTPPSESEGQQCEIPSSPYHETCSLQQTSPNHRHPFKVLNPTMSSPAILPSESSPPMRQRVVSFRHCKAGEEHGQFRADYLGSKDVDSYINIVNLVAKQLVDQRPAEVVAYVSSQKIRLAPPKNEAVLFKSFAVKDILMVEKCTINKRIIGIIVWKLKSRPPTCHILRCKDEIASKAFYEAVWGQSQTLDDVNLDKTDTQTSSSPSGSPSHPNDTNHQLNLSDIVESSSPSSVSSSQSSSSGVESSSSSNNSTPSYREVTGFSATEVLHRFPAMYIGEAVAGKLHSIDDIIQNVLIDSRPTLSKELYVCLSFAEVKFVEVRGDEEVVCMAHETSRIRAMGVYTQDKRIMGYIIKEEGKPLMSYALRCNSAGLMVSLVSFLRQSCQLTSFQRGGSFYDELAADDGDDCDYIIDGSAGLCDSLNFVKRLRSLTVSFSHRTNLSTSAVTRPSFQSHTQLHKKLSPAHDVPQRRRDSINSPTVFSPFDFTDEDYAKFRVTYIGSAALDPPLTRHSVVDAMNKFSEHGVAAGQAAVTKNSIVMQVSALGVNLTDKKRKLFVTRNYPRKQLQGYCAHPNDDGYFCFASRRPGYSSSLKVHVFKRGSEPVEQILDAIKFWLEIDPITF